MKKARLNKDMKRQLAHYEPWENPIPVRNKDIGDSILLISLHICVYSMILFIFGGISAIIGNWTPLLLTTIIYTIAVFLHRIPKPEIEHYTPPSGLRRLVEIKKYSVFFIDKDKETRTYNHYDPSKLNGQIEDIIMKDK